MRRCFLACLLAVAFVAGGQAQSLTVQKLVEFVRSEQKLIREGKDTDRKLATYLANIRLTEKLDASVVEDFQAAGLGPLSLKALQKLQEQSQGLKLAVLQMALPDIPLAPPSAEEQGRVLQDVRDYVRNYDNSLPDFICAEFEERSRAMPTRGTPSFERIDTITSRITYFEHHEVKTTIMHNDAPVTSDYNTLGGSTSQGDFANMLSALFDPATEARFEWARWATLRDKRTMVFHYRVAKDRSRYQVGVPDRKLEVIAAYSGEVFIDAAEPHAVTALTLTAENLPEDFPVRHAQTRLDYQYVDIGGHRFLLPYTEEIRMETADSLSRNANTFKGYRKYEVGSEITFDIPKDLDPKPAVDCKDPKNKNAPGCKPAER